MRLLQLLSGPGATPRYRLAVSAGLSGLSSTLILAIVNIAAQEIANGSHDGVDWFLAAGFGVCIAIYLGAEVYLTGRVTRDIEASLHGVRVRLLDLLRQADLLKLEHFGQARLYESITQGSESISRNAPYLAMMFRSILLVIAIMIYIGTVSFLAVGLIIAVILVGGWKYVGMAREVQARYAEVMHKENQLFESTTDLLDGFKEVRLSSARSDDLAAAFAAISTTAKKVGVDVRIAAFHQSIFGQVAFFFMLGVIVFAVPAYSSTLSADIVKVTTAALFMIGPLSSVIQSVTVFGSVEADAERMFQLEQLLTDMREPEATTPKSAVPATLDVLTMNGVTFTYPPERDDQPYAIGPIDLTLRQGEIVFITGGNGAGKTTLVKLLAGLYLPEQGAVTWNGIAVTAGSRQDYRERIAAVFSDFHLFQRFHGTEAIDPGRAEELLALMEMDGIVTVGPDGFSRVDLSAGQRKRLALVSAMLANRPLLILDEWAADQDPRFRQRFYRELLPRLRAEGRTVIAITHDDHYFDAADRRLHLENGRLSELNHGIGGRS